MMYYLMGDHLGSTSITTDSSGVRTAEKRYYPWGTERYTSGTTPTTFKFTGQREESGIGLYFYNARWYDPSAGRSATLTLAPPGEHRCRLSLKARGNISMVDRWADAVRPYTR